MSRVKGSSPSKGGLDKGHGPIDLGAVSEGFDVGGVDGYGVDQSAGPDSITDWKKRKTGQTAVLGFISLSLSQCRSTFWTGPVTFSTALCSILSHFVHPRAAGADTGPARHHVVVYRQTKQRFIDSLQNPEMHKGNRSHAAEIHACNTHSATGTPAARKCWTRH